MISATIETYLEGKNADGARLFKRFQELVEQCGPSEAAVSKTVIFFKRKRVFAGGFVNGKRLEIVIDLLREVEHPCVIASFASTKKSLRTGCGSRTPPSSTRGSSPCCARRTPDVGPGTR